MKAVVWTAYGPPDVLQLREIETPAPGDDEVRIRIRATTVTSGDCEQRSLRLPIWYALPMRAVVGLTKPTNLTILGMELAGEVESAGKKAKRFKEGDQVFAATGFIRMGTYAEYICLPEEPKGGALAAMPANLTFEEAAAVPVGGLEALAFLRQGDVQSGQRVLINGAGGTVGTFAVQLARYLGAEVVAVDSTAKLDMLRSLGASQVIDYTQHDFTTRGQTYDFILDVVGKGSFSGIMGSLSPDGCYLVTDPGPSLRVRGRLTSKPGGKKVLAGAVCLRTEDLTFLRELVEAGDLRTVVDRCYPLEQAAEAHRYVETGQKKGHVILAVQHEHVEPDRSAAQTGASKD